MKKLLVLIFAISLIACGNSKKELLTENEMISFFENNKKDFELLSGWMLEDKLNYIPLFISEKENNVKLKISKERENAYNELMDRLSIERIVYDNSITCKPVVFYMPEVEENSQKVSQGYVYRKSTQFANGDWIETNDNLLDAMKKSPLNTFITKPINENWSLLVLRQ